MSPLLSAVVSIALSVAAQFSLKAGISSLEVKSVLAEPLDLRSIISIFANKYIFFGFLLYCLGGVIWLSVISKWDVSKAYPMVGLGFVFSVGIGYLIGEGVTSQRLFGVALICAGVILVGKS